jgi:regulator of cell morphogenesis and NO signaling
MADSTVTVGSIVAEDYRAAAVFQKHGIDFCCGGQQLFADACRARGIDAVQVAAELDAAISSGPGAPRFKTWSLELLARYIESNHHRYVRQAIDTLDAHTRKIAEVHGENHPELSEIATLFQGLAADLASHLQREEQVLFPHVYALVAASPMGSGGAAARASASETIREMEGEHEAAGAAMAKIRRLSGGFVPPGDACTTYRVTYQELAAFEADLHQHVHLENNILFPGVRTLEQRLLGR